MNDHDKIQEILLKLPFVKWDRFTLDCESRDVKMYGWIDREKDAFKDFILVSFEEGEVVGFTTSSAKYTHEINKILGFYDDEHSECMRVDESFPEVKNATHLKQ